MIAPGRQRRESSSVSDWANVSRILASVAVIAILSLMLGFAFFLIFESAAMILFYSARRWQAPRRVVLLTTGVDVQRGERDRPPRPDRWAVTRIVVNITLRAGFMIVGLVLLARVGFEGQNLFWLLFAR